MTNIRQAGVAFGLAVILVASTADIVVASPRVMQTNLPEVTTVLTPTANFDPASASDADIAANGLPPRPDKQVSPGAFAAWERAVTSKAVRVLPVLRRTNIRHGLNRGRGVTDSTALSDNWSGYVLLNSVTSYSKSSFDVAMGNWVVPKAQQAIGMCSGATSYSSTWVGIDGAGSSDVLQAGTEADAYCGGSITQPYYDAWYEWYPNNEVAISNFAVSAGDDVYVQVWSTGASTGHAYMIDYTTEQTVNMSFSAPPGVSLVGNSAEWIVERPTVNGSLPALTNYVQDFFSDAYVGDFAANISQPGAAATGVTAVPFQMIGSSTTDVISKPTLLGTNGIWFQDGGSAY